MDKAVLYLGKKMLKNSMAYASFSMLWTLQGVYILVHPNLAGFKISPQSFRRNGRVEPYFE